MFFKFQSVIVKSIERNAGNMYLARQILLGLKSDIKITALNAAQLKRDASLVNSAPMSLAALGEFFVLLYLGTLISH